MPKRCACVRICLLIIRWHFSKACGESYFLHNAQLELLALIPDVGHRFAQHAILPQHGHDILGLDSFHLVEISVHFDFRSKTELVVMLIGVVMMSERLSVIEAS